jgi:hypothetical protein
VTDTVLGAAPHDHSVCFYDHDSHLVADVAAFILDGLTGGERVVVVATAEHRDALENALAQAGTDPVWARCSGRYVALDASETLARFMVNDAPDNDAFLRTVGPVLDAATAGGSPLRLFGEMVGLLWSHGNVVGALQLEQLWNRLADRRQFRMLCGYPARILTRGSLDGTRRICAVHSEVLAPRNYSTLEAYDGGAPSPVATSAVFLPIPASVPPARRFVAGTLSSWGRDDLQGDAALIASELATNAVKHSTSPFRVSVECGPAHIRLAVEDLGSARPHLLAAAPDDHGGRGLAIVQHLAHRWGCDVLPVGKVIWAELADRP